MSTCIVQNTGIGSSPECHDQNSGENAGSGIASIALQDPSRARQMFESVLKAMSDSWARRDLARGLAETLAPPAMSKLAETKDGRAMLERALAELKGNHGEAANDWLADQIQATLQMTDLKGSDAFKRLDPASQQYLLTLLGMPWTTTHPTAASNLIALACSKAPAGRSRWTMELLAERLSLDPLELRLKNYVGQLIPLLKDGLDLTPAQRSRAVAIAIMETKGLVHFLLVTQLTRAGELTMGWAISHSAV